MKLIAQLTAEHDLIDAMLGSFRTWAQAWARGEGSADDGRVFLRFFHRWAGDFHHAREEDVLFPALVTEASLPLGRGPLAVIANDHVELAALRETLEQALRADDAAARARVDALAVTFSHRLWHHLDAENSVLFPEAEERLRQHGVYELTGREPTPDELDAKRAAEALLPRFPPVRDPTIYRGDGCIMCPAYGETCRGLEREWWTEAEWEGLEHRGGSD